jgi:hypothetical protein
VLALAAFGAAAFFGFGVAAAKLFEAVVVFRMFFKRFGWFWRAHGSIATRLRAGSRPPNIGFLARIGKTEREEGRPRAHP